MGIAQAFSLLWLANTSLLALKSCLCFGGFQGLTSVKAASKFQQSGTVKALDQYVRHIEDKGKQKRYHSATHAGPDPQTVKTGKAIEKVNQFRHASLPKDFRKAGLDVTRKAFGRHQLLKNAAHIRHFCLPLPNGDLIINFPILFPRETVEGKTAGIQPGFWDQPAKEKGRSAHKAQIEKTKPETHRPASLIFLMINDTIVSATECQFKVNYN